MSETLKHIAEILNIRSDVPDVEIDVLLTDSRKYGPGGTSLFFALSGPRRNGHQYIPLLFEKGQKYFVVSHLPDLSRFPGAVFLHVPDVLEALQKVAAAHRSRFSYPVIGITGSNGKTVVKEWLFQLLHPDKNIVRSPKSYNSQIGVPLSVWQMSDHNNLAIFEAGISQPGEMTRLQTIIQPTIGILTNIGTAHSEGFENDQDKLKEKLILFKDASLLIAPGDSSMLKDEITSQKVAWFSWGREEYNTLRILEIRKDADRTNLVLQYENDRFSFAIPFTDQASVENAITCCALVLSVGYTSSDIARRMLTLQPVSMRLEYKKGINNCILINDSYSADLNALSIALEVLQQQAGSRRKTVILSDFTVQMEDNRALYGHVVDLLRKHGVNRLIGIGPQLQSFIPEMLEAGKSSMETTLYPNTREFMDLFNSRDFRDEVILVKGARVFGFEEIVAALEQKVHQTILEISLDAISHNLKLFQSRLKPETRMMVMVKAFAYGSGAAEIAGVLQYQKTDYLGVAYADEGVELRRSGITLPIMVMNSEEIAFDAITDHNLEPDMFSFEMLNSFQNYLEQSGLENYPVHIEFETGMNRLGFNVGDVERLGAALKGNKYFRVRSVFSHFVASEDPAEDEFTRHQFRLLSRAAGRLQEILEYDFIKHIANSSGITRFPDMQMDMVRLGIGLYGIGEMHGENGLRPVLTLKSTIAQVKKIAKGETVSYNRRGVANRDSVIATVRIGYADGYSRRFGNGVGKMIIRGNAAPVMGTVCMDMTMIDVTDIPDVQEGDEVILFGEELPVQQLAGMIGTIPYEIMTGISQRVKRVYWGES